MSTVFIFLLLQKELPTKKDCPHMCAYKLVTVKFKWWGLQNKVENFIQKVCWPTAIPYWSPWYPCRPRWRKQQDDWPQTRCLQECLSYFPLWTSCQLFVSVSAIYLILPSVSLKPNTKIFSPFISCLCAAREALVHQLPPSAILLDRQVDRLEHGGHSPHGGGDAQGARRSKRSWAPRCNLQIYSVHVHILAMLMALCPVCVRWGWKTPWKGWWL